MTNPNTYDPYKWHARGIAALFFFTLPVIGFTIEALKPAPPVDPWAAAADSLGVTPRTLLRGHAVYTGTCTTCHGPEGDGVLRLGKPLRNSAFVQASSNDALFALIAEGRLPTDPANTTGIPMPPRGAQGLQDFQIRDVVHYLRTLQDPSAPPASLEPWLTPVVPPPVAQAAPAAAPAPTNTRSDTTTGDLLADAAGAPPSAMTDGGPQPTGDPVVDTPAPASSSAPADEPPPAQTASARSAPGATTFVSFCSACHGPDGGGLPNLGKPLNSSEFVRAKTDKELTTFIKTGRPIWDPENTTGLDMPPKGGNPALNDDQIAEIITFIRAIQQ